MLSIQRDWMLDSTVSGEKHTVFDEGQCTRRAASPNPFTTAECKCVLQNKMQHLGEVHRQSI